MKEIFYFMLVLLIFGYVGSIDLKVERALEYQNYILNIQKQKDDLITTRMELINRDIKILQMNDNAIACHLGDPDCKDFDDWKIR